jgi:hypothetical protein
MDETKLQLLLDRMEISDVVTRYCVSADMRDWEGHRSVFADEVEFDHSSVDGTPRAEMKADEWMQRVRRIMSGLKATQHTSTNHVITFEGDQGNEATCISYLHALHYLPNEKGEDTMTMGGYYTNHLIRTPQGWKIDKCKLTITWSEGNWHVFELAAHNHFAQDEPRNS